MRFPWIVLVVIALLVSAIFFVVGLTVVLTPLARQAEPIPELDVCQDIIVCSNDTTFDATPGL